MKTLLLLTLFFSTTITIQAQCLVEAKFSYSVAGDYLSFVNTSTDEPTGPDYFWLVGGQTTIAESPNFYIPDLVGDTEIEIYFFVDNLPTSDCRDAIHIFIPKEMPVDCPPSVPDFYYTFDAEEITFVNTSEFVEPEANVYWNIGGTIYEDDDASITFPLSDFEGVNYYSLHIDYTADIPGCKMRTNADSTIIGIESAGLDKNGMNETDFQIYPLPASEMITISFENDLIGGRMVVYDLLGNIVISETVVTETNQVELAISHLQNGTYMVNYQSENGEISIAKRFVKVGS